MSLRFAVLASGSKANCFFIASEKTSILIDAGLCSGDVYDKLRAMGEDMHRIQGVAISHAHTDHSNGLSSLVSSWRLPIYTSVGTQEELLAITKLKLSSRHPDWHIIDSAGVVTIGDLKLTTFPVPHDSAQPVGFYVTNGNGSSVAIATDLGSIPDEAQHWLERADTVFLESNYDVDMLDVCAYHPAQKNRVARWHLSNEVAADFVNQARPEQHIVLGHISSNTNSWELVKAMHRKRPNTTVARPGTCFEKAVLCG
jgi:phosphoribosyl 1,2-cyclic phosphodiesterase